MQIPLEQMITICKRELKSKVKIIAIAFFLISLVVVFVGSTWPREYESSVTILADQGRLAGRTLGDNIQNAAEMVDIREASELMFSRQVLDRILEVGGWAVPNMTELTRDELRKAVRQRSDVAVNGSLLTISYKDSDPRRAFLVASEFAEQFIRQSAATSLQASRETYEFIDQQVNDYHKKLSDAEERLKNFRSSVVDASPERKAQSFGLIEDLERNLRQTSLALREARIAKTSLEEQIAAEAGKSNSSSTADLYRRRLSEMQDQLDILRLSYHDSYPDIVQLKQQIQDMRGSIDKEERRYAEGVRAGTESAGPDRSYSLLYQELRASLSRVLTEIKTHEARINEYESRLASEKQRAMKMGEGQAEEAELVRDYQVNQEYYQNLLRRRENARLSMNLALQEAGLSYKVQEKANFPQSPTGLRFFHFVLAGPFLGLGIPIAFFLVLIQVDPRLRSTAVLEHQLELPVLGQIPPADEERGLNKKDYSMIIGALAGVGLLYIVIIIMRTGGSKLAEMLGGLS